MRAYQEIKSMVEKSDLDLIHISGPARGGTTPLEIAMAQSGDGLVHEPFHERRRATFEEGCSFIATKAKELLEQKKAPVRLIVKDLAKYLTAEEWEQLIAVARCIIFCIREPTQYFSSLITRRANEFEGDFRGDSLTRKQIHGLLARIPREKWVDTSWEKLLDFLRIAKAKQIPYGIVSNLALRADPVSAMEHLREHFHLGDVDVERMATRWSIGTQCDFYVPPMKKYGAQSFDDLRKSAWLGKVLTSKGFLPLNAENDCASSLEGYPDEMRNHVIHEVLPVFFTLFGDEHNVAFAHKRLQEMVSNLSRVNVIEAYTLAVQCRRIQGDSQQFNVDISNLENRLGKMNLEFVSTLRSLQRSC